MPKVHEFLTPEHGGPIAAYTEAELVADAKNCATRAAWQAAGEKIRAEGKVSPYMCALRYPDFFKKHCQHMEQRHQWTDEELVAAAAKYQHKGDWKRSGSARDSAAYQVAQARPEVFKLATAHMTPKASPYAGTYRIYAFEFADRTAYIGLTFRDLAVRKAEHASRGPVFEHLHHCPDYELKEVASGINTPEGVVQAERDWIGKYKVEGWRMLNQNEGGGLGTVRVKQWTKELVVEEAKKYSTRKQWAVNSRNTYNTAKREGWFDEASAHMPKRELGVGLGRKVSAATRRKQREAKLGKSLAKAHRNKISESMRDAWAVRSNATPLGPP
jgi:hypothetical protein